MVDEELDRELDLAFVWAKGHPIPNKDSTVWRRDDYQMPMRFSDYGNRDSDFGWEIDHIVQKKDGGSDKLENLRPLNWKSNVARNKERK